ncbi:hypothetical protein DL765_000439 [Monosporascus sp. GIB2]|nr:hypothetical protein DL765_000439 [Monosporascus sp. GIB2]
MSTCPQANTLREAGLRADQILMPSDAEFAARQSSYWSRSARSLQPACIVEPESAQDVAAAVRALVAARVPFAVRSGGHMAWAGANNIGDGGVTVDLGRMDWVQVLPEGEMEKTVDIGPGNRWARVYTELQAQGLAVVGGREGNVGVAGLILGGGMAFFAARHGLACDSVVEFEVVLADGRIVRARQDKEHADLFRALKGGGGNFGIVTNFQMRALPARPVWAGMTVHPKEATPDAIRALKDFTDDASVDVDSHLLCFFTYTAGLERAPAYKKWLKMPTIANTCKITTIPQVVVDYGQAKDYYNTWFTATFKNDDRIVAKAAELHDKLVEELKAFIPDGDFITQCLFQPFPQLIGQLSAAAGGNIMGIDQQRHNGLLWLAVTQVRTPEQEAFAYVRVRDWVRDVRQFAATIEGNLEWTYLNYADGSQDPLASYGPENVRLMADVAAKYDPEGVFQTLSSGGFKLSNTKLPN